MSAKRVSMFVLAVVCTAGVAFGQTFWVAHPHNPILGPGDPGEWDAGGRAATTVISDGSTRGGPRDSDSLLRWTPQT